MKFLNNIDLIFTSKTPIQMKTKNVFKLVAFSGIVLILFLSTIIVNTTTGDGPSDLDCKLCHSDIFDMWQSGSHSDTQKDVADELAAERDGQSADTVIHGSDAENCIACHGPLAVTKNGGMTEVVALEHYFSTTNGVFTSATDTLNSITWPHIYCTTCHNVLADHPSSLPEFGFFNSSTSVYDSIGSISSLCGRCHGNLQFEGTDHLTYNAWSMSTHALTQDDVSEELAAELAGESPEDVINGPEPENCIACHGPTAVLANGGMNEVEALDYFFSTEDGVFTANTTSLKGNEWPDVSCIVCHNPHEPNLISYFNSSSQDYELMNSSAELCGQCHGNLRFPDTDHLSYNIEKGVGPVGVDFQETMTGITCTDCHMASGPDDTNAAMYHGHSWSISVMEEDGSETVSCQNCHTSMDAEASEAQILAFQDEAASSLAIAEEEMVRADSLMNGSTDADLLAILDSAMTNLAMIQGDESGGFHNHKYQMDLLSDLIQKLDKIISVVSGINENSMSQLAGFSLSQNYPNPFNGYTNVRYSIPYSSYVHLNIYDNSGRLMSTIVNKFQNQGIYEVNVDMSSFTAGNYIYVLRAGSSDISKTMILLK